MINKARETLRSLSKEYKALGLAVLLSVFHATAQPGIETPLKSQLQSQQQQQPQQQPQQQGHAKIAGLQIVDCLLPGQLRSLGNSSFLTPRRPVQTTAADCNLRGGEYVAYDRANYKTALNVWLPSAKDGNAEAQTNVGEIFERGLGGEPNYEAALIWYQKAALQGNARAQFNLGTLYEQGLGIEKNKLEALNWYRQAWGLAEDSLIYQSAANKEQAALRLALQREIDAKGSQVKLLQKQIDQLTQKLNTPQASNTLTDELNNELSQLKNWIKQLTTQQTESRQQMAALPKFREPQPVSAVAKQSTKKTSATAASPVKFGKYYALIIGNQHYSQLDDLGSPLRDTGLVKKLLEEKYGFSVQWLTDVDNISVMQAINDLNEVVTENDNLLIFYAGHGSRVKTGELESGYWLPINANPPPNDTFWVSNEFVTRHLARIKAKRVLVVADSCYAGLLSSAPGYLFVGNETEYGDDYVRYKLDKKARLLLSSGGDRPVLDNAGGGNSVFARALLDALTNNNEILSGPELFLKIRDRVKRDAKNIGVSQQPEFKAIKGAGHEVGDFFFVPTGMQG